MDSKSNSESKPQVDSGTAAAPNQVHSNPPPLGESDRVITVKPPLIIQSLTHSRKRSLNELHGDKIPYPQDNKRRQKLQSHSTHTAADGNLSLELQFASSQRERFIKNHPHSSLANPSFKFQNPHKFMFDYTFDDSVSDAVSFNGSTPLNISADKTDSIKFANVFKRIMTESKGFRPNLSQTEYVKQVQQEDEEFLAALAPKQKFQQQISDDENAKESWKLVCGQIGTHCSQWTKQHDTCRVLSQKLARRNLHELLTNVKRTVRVSKEQMPIRGRKLHRDIHQVWNKSKGRGDTSDEILKTPKKKDANSSATTTTTKGTSSHKLSKEERKREKAKEKELKAKLRKEKKEREKAERAAAAAKAKEEREAIKRKQEEEEKLRNERKLNFLLTQTELYTHFMASGGKQGSLESNTGADGSEKNTTSSLHDVIPQELRDSLNRVPTTTTTTKSKKKAKALEQEAKISEDQAIENARRAFEEQRKHRDDFDQAVAKFRDTSDESAEQISSTDDLDLQEPELLEGSTIMQEPPGFQGKLKEYQKKGLTWLAMLYEQGINGILADEMGLGKTVQTISFLGHLAINKGIWGPFVVIAPSSTLHNWQAEIEKFCPDLRALPYWGSPKDRKVLRRYWNEDFLYKKESRFHVLVTSYGLLLEDMKSFNRIRWQYLILDEAHWIKSAKSQRWQNLLSFRCRNRLLLTGTPIQNNMAELWALLHFIMPSLFDSHDEFNEWFSKDIENKAAKKGSKLNNEQLKRLHLILKPFMLRRIKKDVEMEMPKKTELTIYCGYSSTQRKIIQQLKHQITSHRYSNIGTSSSRNSMLKNLVMQFRKVCNHPQLFKKEMVHSAYSFCPVAPIQSFLPKEITGKIPECFADPNRSLLSFQIPKLLWKEGAVFSGHRESLMQGDWDMSFRQEMILSRKFDIFSRENIYSSLQEEEDQILNTSEYGRTFSFLKFLDLSVGETEFLFHASLVERFAFFVAELQRLHRLHYVHNSLQQEEEEEEHSSFPRSAYRDAARARINELYRPTALVHHTALYLQPASRKMWSDLIFTSNPAQFYQDNQYHITMMYSYADRVSAAPVNFLCSDRRFANSQDEFLYHPWLKQWLIGYSPRTAAFRQPIYYYTKTGSLLSSVLPRVEDAPQKSAHSAGLLTPFMNIFKTTTIQMPSVSRLISQSGKLRTMDNLLKKLKKEGHRVLIFSQMTRMLDLIEQYMWARNHLFLRLDGQSTVQDRRDMVQAFQSDENIFAFLLSTRAGGLGITLTAADTVIFYDCDWNPTSDQQAMDRCHRIGQERDVTVYRIITKGSVEERILSIAQRKQRIQQTVYSGEFKTFEDTTGTEDDELLDAIFEDSDLKDHKESFLKEKQKTEAEEAAEEAGKNKPATGKKRGRKPGSKNKSSTKKSTADKKKSRKSGKKKAKDASKGENTENKNASKQESASTNDSSNKLTLKSSGKKESSKKRKRDSTAGSKSKPAAKKVKTSK